MWSGTRRESSQGQEPRILEQHQSVTERAFCLPGTVLRALNNDNNPCIDTQEVDNWCDPHFTNEKTEAQRGITFPRSHRSQVLAAGILYCMNMAQFIYSLTHAAFGLFAGFRLHLVLL